MIGISLKIQPQIQTFLRGVDPAPENIENSVSEMAWKLPPDCILNQM